MTNDKPYLALTAADKAIMESYAAMVPNLGTVWKICTILLFKMSTDIIPEEQTALRLRIWRFPCYPKLNRTKVMPISVI